VQIESHATAIAGGLEASLPPAYRGPDEKIPDLVR
jgi:hypothetical protein